MVWAVKNHLLKSACFENLKEGKNYNFV